MSMTSRDPPVFQIRIPLDEHDALGAALEDVFQPRLKVGFQDRILVDHQRFVFVDRNDHRAEVGLRSAARLVCAGCGTSASSPLGVTGAMTMKMINSTSSTSMSGVTLMSHLVELPEPPTAIDIMTILLESTHARSELAAVFSST